MFAPDDIDSFESSWLPAVDEDWHSRPLYVGTYAGVLLGDTLIPDRVQLETGMLAGLRFGQDYDRRWSWETRIAYARAGVTNAKGPAEDRDGDLFLGDGSFVYSLWATRRLRPYVSFGAGTAYLDTTDDLGQQIREFMPLLSAGAGFRYRIDEWLLLHGDVHDDLALGEQVDLATMHNFSVAAGLEIRYGNLPNVYYPWAAKSDRPW